MTDSIEAIMARVEDMPFEQAVLVVKDLLARHEARKHPLVIAWVKTNSRAIQERADRRRTNKEGPWQ